jgi:hypothetical protein
VTGQPLEDESEMEKGTEEMSRNAKANVPTDSEGAKEMANNERDSQPAKRKERRSARISHRLSRIRARIRNTSFERNAVRAQV